MPPMSSPAHRPLDRVQDHPLAPSNNSDSLRSSHTLPSRSTNIHTPSPTPEHSKLTSSSLPSPGKGRRKPAPRITSDELDDTVSNRHLSEDISRYPSTVTGHIGCATRDDRFADASGPYQLVPVDEYGAMMDLPKQLKMFSEASRDPTVSSFEAFVLAPSSSSFTIYDKTSSNKKDQTDEAELNADGSVTEGKERKTPKSSPLKNQVKVSMESRRTITSTKASSDTIRSGATTVEVSHSSTKTKQSWHLFSRIENSARLEYSEATGRTDSPSPSRPSPRSAITPQTQRQLRKLSVQPVSPFQVPPLAQDTSPKKSPARRSKAAQHGEQTPQADPHGLSPPASDKTIRSFSALNRASIDTPAMAQRGNGWTMPLSRVDETPTKRKRANERDIGASPTQISQNSLAIPANNNGRIKLVSGTTRAVSSTSISALPRVETRYLDDDDLVVRLEANERTQPAAENTHGDGDAKAGYWDYSIVAGVEGSPSRDYSLLLRNASLLKHFTDLSGFAQGGKENHDPTSRTSQTRKLATGQSAAYAATLTAPRTSSDRSLTCSSNYPDDTDDVSEQSRSNYSGKRRGGHAMRRQDQSVSMASLAAPLGEDLATEGKNESDAPVSSDGRAVGVALPMQPGRRLQPSCESSFAQSLPEGTTDSEAGTLFTRFLPPPTSPSSTAQIDQSRAALCAFQFPAPPSEKHSSLLSEILAVTRESYQARKQSQEQDDASAPKKDDLVNLPRTAISTHRPQRVSMIASRQGDPQLQVIHENEAVTTNLPLTSESLRELDRRLANENMQRNESNMSRTRSAGDLTLHSQRLPATVPAALRMTAIRRDMISRPPPENVDTLSVATSTTMRPFFNDPQRRQLPTMQSNVMHTITHQPSRSTMPLRPVRRGNSPQRDDELPEGVFSSDRQLASPMCVCLGHRLW